MLSDQTILCVKNIIPIYGFFRFYEIVRKLAVIVLYVSILIICAVAFIGKVHASNVCKVEVARIVSIQGTIEVRRVQQRQQIWQLVTLNTVLCLGDMIRSRKHSRATLRLANESILNLNQKSSMTFLPANEEKKSFLMQLLEGVIHIITRTPKPFDVTTPFVNASVHGTEFLVEAAEENSRVVVYEGKVAVTNDYGSVVLNDREAATASQYQAPQKNILIHPTDAVQWALYYPTLETYWLREDADASGTAALIQQASDALIVGQADEAKSVIAQVLRREPSNSDAHALLAIIAVTQNDKETAHDSASQAVTFNPQSAVAYIALSYTQQARFEIEEALTSIRKSLEIDAHNALAWARLAELQMSSGELEQALVSAQQAVRFNPNLAKTQTVLGFAHLLQIDTQMAKHTFNQSIALDSADPMPRLGLGLALIREGQLEAGRVQLEIAASLDPANSLIRSYLGKAYFEERRYPHASTQFDLAKERDPKDPTPWLYDAIQKQTQNRPIEALQDIQKSIALNDNRAVYRSKFLLERDEAARGSSLARIFETLGFERRAVMETAKSLSSDPANHSAHRFLSDTYANTPRHEIARVSELLQAQLLQPINVNPVQPHMAVADLNIITGTTPSAVGFNEFAPLMERNKPQIVASGLVGSNGTLGNEVVASMQRDRASVSLGQFHHETNGFRENNDQKHNVYNGFFQYALTPKLNVQAEVRRRETEHGDMRLNFKAEVDKNYHRILNENTARIGARYTLSPNQDLLVSGKYIDRFVEISGLNPSQSDKSGFQIEGQHLYRQGMFSSVIGGGGYDFSDKNPEVRNINRKNFYAYTNTSLLPILNTTLGVSYDIFSNTIGDSKDKINPKFGLQWDILPSIRLRAAWFETTKSLLVAQQSLEPTQVAGFNQFYDDPNGTRSQRMGVGLDAKAYEKIFSGFEISRRLIKIPIGNGFSKYEEELYRAYLYWTLHANWVVKGEFQFEETARIGSNTSSNPTKLQTLSAPASIEYFHPLGIFSRFTTTFVQQDLIRGNRSSHPIQSGIDNFVLLDFSAGFRFPNRRGILSLEGRNLLDENFYYMDDSYRTSESVTTTRFIPQRTILLKLTLNF
jgi:tetratricopeptide (TPR) repeat protein